MNKLLWRYLIYFGIFICFVQIMESTPLQDAFAKVGLKMNFEALGTYAPLFLSALLIDITYRIGKRQNEIAERQNQIELHKLYKDLYATIYAIEQFSQTFVEKIYDVLSYSRGQDDYVVQSIKKKIIALQNNLNNMEVSFRLLLPNKDFETFKGVQTLMALSSITLQDAVYVVNVHLKPIADLQKPSTEECCAIDTSTKELYMKELISILLDKNGVKNSCVINTVNSFIRYRQESFGGDNNILNRIIDDVKIINKDEQQRPNKIS